MTQRARRSLDRVLVERGEASDLAEARALIAEARVVVDGAPALSAARRVAASEAVVVISPARFVGRGGEKLAGALAGFDVDVTGRTALDVGASTGGFTDCLIASGARLVLAVDVGRGQLHERLAGDGRVVSLERTNIRDLDEARVAEALGGPPEVVTVDISFASVTSHVAHVVELAAASATLLVLVKPQFEVSHAAASRGRGVVRDPEEWQDAIVRCASALQAAGGGIMGVMASPLRGASGNVEFFVHALKGVDGLDAGQVRARAADAIRVVPS